MQTSPQKTYLDTGNVDVISQVKGNKLTILDVGCGGGSNARHFSEMGNIVDGITISEKEGELARPYLRHLYIQNLEEGLPDTISENEYDYVICSHVLEHIAYPEKLLKDITKALKKNGYIVMALPNIMHYSSRFELLKGNMNYKTAGIFDYTHLRWYTFDTARKLLERNGFEIEFSGVTGKVPGYSLLGRVLSLKAHDMLYSTLTYMSKGFFGYQLLFKALNKKQNTA